jgi:hypothetical protein
VKTIMALKKTEEEKYISPIVKFESKFETENLFAKIRKF